MAKITIKDEWIWGAKNLSDNIRAEVLGAIVLYMMEGSMPEVSKNAAGYLKFIVPSIDTFMKMTSRVSESKKRYDHGTTMVQPRSDHGATKVEPRCDQGETMVTPGSPTPLPEDRSMLVKKETKVSKDTLSKERKSLDLSGVAPEFKDVVEEWLAYKMERRENYKQRGFEQFYKSLVKDSNGDPELARAWMENSMANNYAGLIRRASGPSAPGPGPRPKRAMDIFEQEAKNLYEQGLI